VAPERIESLYIFEELNVFIWFILLIRMDVQNMSKEERFALFYGIMLGDGCLSLVYGKKKYSQKNTEQQEES